MIISYMILYDHPILGWDKADNEVSRFVKGILCTEVISLYYSMLGLEIGNGVIFRSSGEKICR